MSYWSNQKDSMESMFDFLDSSQLDIKKKNEIETKKSPTKKKDIFDLENTSNTTRKKRKRLSDNKWLEGTKKQKIKIDEISLLDDDFFLDDQELDKKKRLILKKEEKVEKKQMKLFGNDKNELDWKFEKTEKKKFNFFGKAEHKGEQKIQHFGNFDEDIEEIPDIEIIESDDHNAIDLTELDGYYIQPDDLSEEFVLSEKGATPAIMIPIIANQKLKDFQKDGVKFMYNLFIAQRGGILADDMGLGKTVQSVVFVSTCKGGKSPMDKSNFFFSLKKRKEINHCIQPSLTSLPFLVVCPASVMGQWESEFRKWAQLKVDVFYGKSKNSVLQITKNNKIDVVITSYDTFRLGFDDLNALDWACVIFDEVHKIKNKSTKLTLKCRSFRPLCKIGLSGTVVQNDLKELWTLSDCLYPGFLGTMDHFKKKYELPIKQGQKHDASKTEMALARKATMRLINELKELLLRRTKDDVLDELPGKEENVIFCKMSDLQIECYQRVLQSKLYCNLRRLGKKTSFESINDKHDTNDWRREVFPAISNLQKISNHLSLLIPTEEKDPDKLLKQQQFAQLAFGDHYNEISHISHAELSGKLAVLENLLPQWKQKDSKVLIFSTSTKILDLLEHFLKKKKFKFTRIDGSVSKQKREDRVDMFNRDQSIFIFLISTKAGGLGLNLTSADRVVIFDPSWNVSWDLQAQDRAYRIGQKKKTRIYRMITAGGIEDITYTRQVYKQQLANITLEGNFERRYFNGMSGVKGEEGDIFGLKNLLSFNSENVLTSEFISREEKRQELYKIEKFDSAVNKNQDSLLNILDTKLQEDEDEFSHVGVLHYHRNTDIIGQSDAESELSKEIFREMSNPLYHNPALADTIDLTIYQTLNSSVEIPKKKEKKNWSPIKFKKN